MKDGDELIQKLRDAAKRRDDIGLLVFALIYEAPWWYWLDYIQGNRN